MSKVTEWCPHCDEEVEIEAIPYVLQKCPNCGKLLRACCLCDFDIVDCSECAKKYRR